MIYEFVGGPLDGEMRALQHRDHELAFPYFAMEALMQRDPDETVKIRYGIYQWVDLLPGIMVELDEHGPHGYYVWQGER